MEKEIENGNIKKEYQYKGWKEAAIEDDGTECKRIKIENSLNFKSDAEAYICIIADNIPEKYLKHMALVTNEYAEDIKRFERNGNIYEPESPHRFAFKASCDVDTMHIALIVETNKVADECAGLIAMFGEVYVNNLGRMLERAAKTKGNLIDEIRDTGRVELSEKEEPQAPIAIGHFFDLASLIHENPYQWLVSDREFMRSKISDLFQEHMVNKNKPLQIVIDYDPDFEYATVRYRNTKYKLTGAAAKNSDI